MLFLVMGGGESPKPEHLKKDEKLKRTKRNAIEIGKFFEFRDTAQRGTAGSYFSIEADMESESTLPISEQGLKTLDNEDNTHFRTSMCYIIGRYWKRPFMLPMRLLEHQPHAIQQWRAGKFDHHKKLMRQFVDGCLFLARRLEIEKEGTELHWHVKPKDEPVGSVREAYEKDKKEETQKQYRRLTEEVDRVQRSAWSTKPMTVQEAKTEVAAAKKLSYWTVHRAWQETKGQMVGLEDSYYRIAEEVANVAREETGGNIDAAKGLVSQRPSRLLGTPCPYRRIDEAYSFIQETGEESA